MAVYAIDQSLETGQDSFMALRFNTSFLEVSQGFKPSVTGVVPYADLYLLKSGSPSGNLTLEIQTDSSGTPSNSAVATSNAVDASGIGTSYEWVRFTFDTPATLTLGTQYHLVIKGDYAVSDTNHIYVGRDISSPPYANGQQAYRGSGAWTIEDPTADLLFREYAPEQISGWFHMSI